MQKHKFQHIVPKFYLRPFSINQKSKAIYVFDKVISTSKRRNLKRIPCEKHFYDLEFSQSLPGVEGQECENRLGRLENRAKEMFDDLFNQTAHGVEIHGKYKFSWAVYLAQQAIRGRKNRSYLGKFNDEQTVKKATIAALTDTRWTIDKFATILSCKFKWYIGLNKTDKRLYSSDEPVVHNAEECACYQGHLELTNSGKQVFFPIIT